MLYRAPHNAKTVPAHVYKLCIIIIQEEKKVTQFLFDLMVACILLVVRFSDYFVSNFIVGNQVCLFIDFLYVLYIFMIKLI